jgi:glutathionylspermidine synthase
MKRKKLTARENWKQKAEEIGFLFHSLDDIYWDETACYSFNYKQIEQIEKATNELYEKCLEAVEYVISNKKYDLLQINPDFIPLIERSWEEDEPSIYGRFDFCYDGINPPKMLEFNADTPTSLYEGSIVQWFWAQDYQKEIDQFNSIHEKLISYWQLLIDYLKPGKLYFASVSHSLEDYITTQYLRDCAIQAGLDTEFIFMENIGWEDEKKVFLDMENQEIRNIFKLYPWEWLIHEEFGQNLLTDKNATFWIEPAWKMILSNKAILPILWELFPNHENLLPAYFEDSKFDGQTLVVKPLLSREGANVSIRQKGEVVEQTEGEYGEEGFVYQAYCPLPDFEGNHPVIGSWLIGGESAGIGIRESNRLITDNFSRFVPHIIEE